MDQFAPDISKQCDSTGQRCCVWTASGKSTAAQQAVSYASDGYGHMLRLLPHQGHQRVA